MDLYKSFEELKQFSGFKPSSLYQKLGNISGKPVVIAYKEHSNQTGFSCMVKHDPSPFARFSYSFEIVSLLQEILNFSVTYKAVDEINYDAFNSPSDGADMENSHPSLENTPDSVQLLLPTLHSRLVIVYQTSRFPLEKDLFLRNTAGGNMWLYLFGVSVLLALCFRLSTHIHHCIKPRHSDWSWLEVVQWTFGAVCQQGSAKLPQGCSCRTMFVIGYLITNLIYTGFAAGITSLLAVRPDQPTGLKWHQALRMNIPYTVVCNSGAEMYLKKLAVNGHEGRKVKCVPTLDELLNEVEHSGTAGVISEIGLLYHYTTHPRGSEDVMCELAVAKQTRHNHFSGFIVKQGSPVITPFNYWLLRIKEYGLLSRMLRRISDLPDCQSPPGYTEVSFEHVKAPFLIIISHMILSLIILCGEILMHKYNVLLSHKALKKENHEKLLSLYVRRSMKFRKIT